MTPSTFAVVIGIVFFAVGVLGFVPGLLAPMSPDAPPLAVDAWYGELLGLFPVNLLHNVVHLAIGAWGIAASRGMRASITFSRGLAVIYGIFAVMGFIPGLHTTFGLVPLFGHDIWLHAGTAAIAAYFGWAQAPREHEARTRTGHPEAHPHRA